MKFYLSSLNEKGEKGLNNLLNIKEVMRAEPNKKKRIAMILLSKKFKVIKISDKPLTVKLENNMINSVPYNPSLVKPLETAIYEVMKWLDVEKTDYKTLIK